MPILISLLLGLPFVLGPRYATQPLIMRQQIGQWTLEVQKDLFTQTTQCLLHAKGMTYERGALVFHLSKETDTFAAMYSVDHHPAVSWRVNAIAIAAKGVPLADALRNPSGGRVAVPIAELSTASTVTIRPSIGHRALEFQLEGLSPALETARKAGCGAAFDVEARH